MEQLLQKFLDCNNKKKLKTAIIGDSLVDQYHNVAVTRLSPEFSMIPVWLSKNQNCVAIPGGAGNVTLQTTHFNVESHLYSLLDDYAIEIFKNLNIENCVNLKNGKNPIKRRLYDNDMPLCRWDIEDKNYGLPDEDLYYKNKLLFDKCCENKLFDLNSDVKTYDAIIFSDYNKGVFNNLLFSNICCYSKTPTIVDPKGKDIEKWYGCYIFKPNQQEAQKLSGLNDWKEQCDYFIGKISCKNVIITQGGDGVVGKTEKGYFEYKPKIKIKPVSVCGAGDAFISVLGMAIGHEFTVEESAKIAFEIGTIYVQGKYNSPVTIQQIREKINSTTAKFVDVKFLKNFKNLIFTNGCFDFGLTQAHVKLLKYAKSLGDKLVVAINSDESVKRLKGKNRPIMSLNERMEILASLEVVDYVICFNEDSPLELIKEIMPSIVVKGGYKKKDVVGYGITKVVVVDLYKSTTTTDKINKMKENKLLITSAIWITFIVFCTFAIWAAFAIF